MLDTAIVQTEIEEPYAERSSIELGGQLVRPDGTGIAGSLLQTLTLTLYVLDASRTIINEVDAINIKNTNRGTIDELGNLLIALELDDAVILNTAKKAQRMVALARWGYLAPGNKARGGGHRWLITIENQERYP